MPALQGSIEKRFGIIGYPLKHSLSPLMHNKSFEYFGLPYRYETLETEPTNLNKALSTYIEQGFYGFNVTIPFKEAILPLIHHLSDEAKAIGAVNTIHITSEGWLGYNTDAYGVLRSLEPYKDDIHNANVLILGAGGAARAVVYILAHYFSPQTITIAARNIQRAQALSSLLPRNSGIFFQHVFETNEDLKIAVLTSKLIINTTPVGMYPEINACPLPADVSLGSKHIVFDVIYRPLKTSLLKKAEEAKAQVVNGLPMLVYQGAEAFKIWTGKEMPVPLVFQHLKEALQTELQN